MHTNQKKRMKKFVLDLQVKAVEHIHERYVLLRLTSEKELPPMIPGQFVEVRVDGSPSTFLRRPISIHFVDRQLNELWLLVATVGEGTRRLGRLVAGETVNCVLPLGNGFSAVASRESCEAPSTQNGGGASAGRMLLVGGGVGVAPLLYLGAVLQRMGCEVTFLLGARTAKDLLMLDEFSKYGHVLTTTEDGSHGERGFVTQHSILGREAFDRICCCGPTPMMKAVVAYARKKMIDCEVSLENMMACGLGACLCCVEKTTEGNVCVCKEGPVFNERQLLWQI